MLIGIIFLINLLSVGIVYFLKWRGWRTAYLWMVLVFVSLVDWFLLILIRVENFGPLVLSNWFSIAETPIVLQFQITNLNWPLVFSILSAAPAFLLTGIARLDVRRDLRLWVSGIIFILFSFLAVTAANLWSLVIIWTALDLMDIFFQLVMVPSTDQTQLRRSLIIRFFGSFLLIYQTATLAKIGINPFFDNLTGNSSVIFILAALFHSGIIPFTQHESVKNTQNSEDLLKGLMRLLIVVTSFSLLSHFAVLNLNFLISLAIWILLFLLLLRFGSVMINGKEDLTNSKSLFFTAFFLVFIYLSGGNIRFWLPALFLPCIFTLFYSHRNQATIIFPILMAVVVSGLPFSLISFGARGIGNGSFLAVILLMIPMVLYLSGFLRKTLAERKDFNSLESIYQLVFLSGLLILILSGGLIAFKFIEQPQNELSFWWVGLLAIILVAGILYFSTHFDKKFDTMTRMENSAITTQIFSLKWLFDFGTGFKNRVRGLASGFSRLLEGTGGLLWALVFLVLILSILQ